MVVVVLVLVLVVVQCHWRTKDVLDEDVKGIMTCTGTVGYCRVKKCDDVEDCKAE
jgi:hypothetical protein